MDETRRRAYLDALGIPLWVPRALAPDARADAGPAAAGSTAVGWAERSDAHRESAGPATAGSTAVGWAERSDAHRESVPSALDTGPAEPVRAAHGKAPADSAGAAVPVDRLDWPALRERVAACCACALHTTRTQTVFGVGSERARLMIVGEAPGADEDRQGEPFVGRAGQLLNAMLRAIGLDRGDVYIANVLKCRPPANRNPSLEEAAACAGFLRRQVALVGPRLILSVGGISARNLLGTDAPVGRLRGTVHEFGPDRVPCLVTYHPAYLLRQPEEKAKAWQDLQLAARLLRDSG